MTDKNKNLIDEKLQVLNNDGVDRRGFLKCMAWAGTGLVWTMSGGIPSSRAFAKTAHRNAANGGDFSFDQPVGDIAQLSIRQHLFLPSIKKMLVRVEFVTESPPL